MKILNFIKRIIKPHGKNGFLAIIQKNSIILDVGCGNNSPAVIKSQLPSVYYVGLDVGDYNNPPPSQKSADEYIIVAPEEFDDKIVSLGNMRFDAVISSHNLEHVNNREKTLDAMIAAVKPGGYIYLSFPTESSINFPSRYGTLNYYDDSSHRNEPPIFNDIINKLKFGKMEILFARRAYKPFIPWVIGWLLESKSSKERRVMSMSTWAYYGFESVIWAKRL